MDLYWPLVVRKCYYILHCDQVTSSLFPVVPVFFGVLNVFLLLFFVFCCLEDVKFLVLLVELFPRLPITNQDNRQVACGRCNCARCCTKHLKRCPTKPIFSYTPWVNDPLIWIALWKYIKPVHGREQLMQSVSGCTVMSVWYSWLFFLVYYSEITCPCHRPLVN